MARMLLGVTGGIAAYKALELARLATKAGHGVRVVMTPTAERFIGRASFEAIVGAPALTDEFDRDPMRGAFPGDPIPDHDPIGHLAVVENADVYLIAPASANALAKLAVGLADSMLTTSFLACSAPRVVAPAMNNRMYQDPATQANLETLRTRGIHVIEPDEGALASRGERGVGRLPEPAQLLAEIEALLPHTPGPWDGLRVLVSAGGTREPLDSVRFIGNRSSGRMGIALAERAAARGADVALVAANVSLPSPAGVERIDVETTAELADALKSAAKEAHVILMAAAVADFRPAHSEKGKIARDGSGSVELALERTDDVLAGLAAVRPEGQTLVGFAAEHGDFAIERTREKLERKGLDLIVFNDISRADIGFESAQNEVTLVAPDDEREVPRASKEDVADAVLDRVAELRGLKRLLH
jgi:phosphopantothenoylcysteine decarboxylase/phosphopantothenate--cysteine ligase